MSCSRRGFLGILATMPAMGASEIEFIDYHAHPGHDLDIGVQVKLASERDVKLGIVEHAGVQRGSNEHLIHNDDLLTEYIQMLEQYPVLKGVQAEGLDWPKAFSKKAVARLDYVLSDALTFPEKNGQLVRLWTPGVTVSDKQDFMDRYTDFNVEVMAREPIDIIANPLFLPEVLQREAETLWSEQRMQRVVDAALKYHVAVEINSRYRVPHERFIRMAMASGVKFSFGSNVHGRGVGQLGYCREVVRRLGLTPKHLFRPAPAGKKPIEIRSYG